MEAKRLDADGPESERDADAIRSIARNAAPGPVSTFSLVAYMLTVLAWELEIGVLVLHIFKRGKLDPLGHAALLACLCSLTVFSSLRGRREFQRLRWTRGRIPISAAQGVVVTFTVFATSGVLLLIGIRLFGL